jgi:hypothetical protein
VGTIYRHDLNPRRIGLRGPRRERNLQRSGWHLFVVVPQLVATENHGAALETDDLIVVDEFCNSIGLDRDRPTPRSERLNRTLSREFVELIRRANVRGRETFGSVEWGAVAAGFEALSSGSRIEIPAGL